MSPIFTLPADPTEVVFGDGSASRIASHLPEEGRVLLLCSAGRRGPALAIGAELGARLADVYDEAQPHVPLTIIERALARLDDTGATIVLTVGGGATTGLGKALARRRDVFLACVPTTLAGSEVTDIWGETDAGKKTTGRARRVKPSLVLYDPSLFATLPAALTVSSAFNAMAHAVEALYAPAADPLVPLEAEEALRRIAAVLPRLVVDPYDPHAREELLCGAWLAGRCLRTSMGLGHKLAHALGGQGLPHAATHAALLPYVLRYNASAAPEAAACVARALRVRDPVEGLWAIADATGAPTALRPLGLGEHALGPVADTVLALNLTHPRAPSRRDLLTLLEAALDDTRAEVGP